MVTYSDNKFVLLVVVDSHEECICFEHQKVVLLVNVGYRGKEGLENSQRFVQLFGSDFHGSHHYLFQSILIIRELG